MAWTLIKADDSMGPDNQRMVYMVESADISTPPDPDNSAAGSVAFTAELDGFWVKDGGGTWTEATSDALLLAGLI